MSKEPWILQSTAEPRALGGKHSSPLSGMASAGWFCIQPSQKPCLGAEGLQSPTSCASDLRDGCQAETSSAAFPTADFICCISYCFTRRLGLGSAAWAVRLADCGTGLDWIGTLVIPARSPGGHPGSSS